jgi:hypothetical protein
MTGERPPLRRPAALSALLLVIGTAAVVARAEVVQRHFYWLGYREEVANIIKGRPWRAAHGLAAIPISSVQKPFALTARALISQAVAPTLTLLVAGALCLLLVALGRRVLWLPIATAGLSISTNVVYLTGNPNVDGTDVVSLALCVAVLAVAAAPLLVALRGVRIPQRQPTVRLIVAMVVVGALFADAVRTLGPWYAGDSDTPEVAPAFALFVFAALIVASPLRRRWVAPVLVAPLLALPPLGQAIGDLTYTGQWSAGGPNGVLWGGLAMLALGAVTPMLARLAASGWRSVAIRGPAAEPAEA